MLAAAALVLVAGYFLTGKKAAASTPPAHQGGSPDQIINNGALPGQPGWGWQYYTGGVAIGPDGTYYLNGVPTWSPK